MEIQKQKRSHQYQEYQKKFYVCWHGDGWDFDRQLFGGQEWGSVEQIWEIAGVTG